MAVEKKRPAEKVEVPEVQFSSLGTYAFRAALLAFTLYTAYDIRLFAIKTYGLVIHEFDPWFNYRATEYLAQHGWTKFFTWFDHRSWYPLGRPVGTTIYPGMQIIAVWLWKGLNAAGVDISLNDVCCYIPAWFGVLATLLLGLLAAECTGKTEVGFIAASIMAMIPAHLMRSVGGGFDNESVAVTAMMLTFYLWTRSLRTKSSWPVAILAGFAYIYMVAAWGGYVFVINMIAAHAGISALRGRHSTKLHRAYTLFYLIGTAGATFVPVVGWTPLKSLEQLGALGVFGALQIFEGVAMYGRAKKMEDAEVSLLRFKAFAAAGALGAFLVTAVAPSGYFGPISSRIRGLFVQHTRTGNPLVDSVAEHQPASAGAYWQYLHYMCWFAPFGFFSLLAEKSYSDARFFLVLYSSFAYFFSAKMVRLVLLMGPVAACLGAVAIVGAKNWCLRQLKLVNEMGDLADSIARDESKPATAPNSTSNRRARGKDAKARKKQRRNSGDSLVDILDLHPYVDFYKSSMGKSVRLVAACTVMFIGTFMARGFHYYSYRMGEAMSSPSIMYKARLGNGQTIIIDDYREAYWWLRDNTPEDARVMSWWDYGYQISGIANRTTLADGNTWNHEHIALLGKCLTSPVTEAHGYIRHLADYVLIWTGGGGDDLAKSPHMARIGNSVYPGLCGDDPTCRHFGFVDAKRTPTPMMSKSLLYNLHGHGQVTGANADASLFENVFNSKYNKVRIYRVLDVSEASKAFSADPANRDCDAGGWYCPGRYPPALSGLLSQKRDFAQLEDFNKKTDAEAEDYQKRYHAAMSGAKISRSSSSSKVSAPEEDASSMAKREAARARSQDSSNWRNSPDTTRMWQLINSGDLESISTWLSVDPAAAFLRSSDGRGPLWWANEFHQTQIIDLLVASGADPDATDVNGIKPGDMA